MTVSDWLTVGSVVIAIGPIGTGLIWVTIASIRAHEKDEV